MATSGGRSSASSCGHLRLHSVALSCWFRWHFIYCETLNLAFTWDRITSTVQLRNEKIKWMIKTRRADRSQTQCIIQELFNNSKLCSSPSSCTSDQAIWSAHNSPSLYILKDPDLGGSYFIIALWSLLWFNKVVMKWGIWKDEVNKLTIKLLHIFDANMDIYTKQVPIVGIKKGMSFDVPSENLL